jgi:hypothetical protein
MDVDVAQAYETFQYDMWWSGSQYRLAVSATVDPCHKDYSYAIGSVKFIQDFIEKVLGHQRRKPINIPKELETYSGPYDIKYDSLYNYSKYKGWFMKDHERVKEGLEPFVIGNFTTSDVNSFVASESLKGTTIDTKNYKMMYRKEIEFVSEFRIFVFRREILDIRQYLGDFVANYLALFEFAKMCVNRYTTQPEAFTIDIGFDKYGTLCIIEVHEFFSVGLYGFNHKSLCSMYKSFFNGL